MPRRREYANNAERQRAYRQRKATEEARQRAELRRLQLRAAHRDRLRKRLVLVLGMLGSAHAGERDNAARQAARMVREAGLTWFDRLNVREE